jgi:hypothetical protein
MDCEQLADFEMKKMNQTAELQTGQTCGFRSSIADAPD